MTTRPTLWVRHESRPGEGRAPVSPQGARELVAAGFPVVVEESDTRVYDLDEYVAAGCRTAPQDSWPDAPEDAIVLGLKELPAGDAPLRDHVYFGHAFKEQHGADDLLRRFVAGGGELLDLEYLVDDDGRRVAAFGYWAGYVGAALSVLAHRGRLPQPLRATSRGELDDLLRQSAQGSDETRALVIGALGRCGRGACDALEVAGITPTRWDVEETRRIDKEALLGHDILVNTVLVSVPVPPFVTDADLDTPGRRLSLICDVTCDVTSDCNVLPVYDEVTTWAEPLRRIRQAGPGGEPPVDVLAIDNLPTMLPREASDTYCADLLPTLLTLPDGPVWQRARQTFAQHTAHLR